MRGLDKNDMGMEHMNKQCHEHCDSMPDPVQRAESVEIKLCSQVPKYTNKYNGNYNEKKIINLKREFFF